MKTIFPTLVVATAIVGPPPAATADEAVGPDRRARFRARYASALADLWNGKPAAALGPLQRLYQDGGCETNKCELRLAQSYRYLGRLEEAETWARAAVARAESKGGTTAEENNELGVCLFQLAEHDPGYLEDAVAALRRAAERHQVTGDTYLYNLARALEVAGHRQEAAAIRREFEASGGLRPVIERGEAVIGDFRRLEIVDRVYPEYTFEARRQGVEGKIVLQAVIDANGKVASSKVLQDLPHGLSEVALKALRKSRFDPATVDGRPVATLYHQEVDMRLTPALVDQEEIASRGHSH